MYGLEAISANNGWAISVVGITIVFTGLVMLSAVISQLHKVLAFYEDPSKLKKIFTALKQEKEKDHAIEEEAPFVFSESQKQVAKQFALLARTMEDHFSLPRLLHMAKISDLKDPYVNLNNLLKAQIIVPDTEGFFTWDKEKFEETVFEQSAFEQKQPL